MKDYKTIKSGAKNPQVNAAGKIDVYQFDPATNKEKMIGNITG